MIHTLANPAANRKVQGSAPSSEGTEQTEGTERTEEPECGLHENEKSSSPFSGLVYSSLYASGHGFSRAVNAQKSIRALTPEVCLCQPVLGKNKPQRLKPKCKRPLSAWLKPCPDEMASLYSNSENALARSVASASRPFFQQSSIPGFSRPISGSPPPSVSDSPRRQEETGRAIRRGGRRQ